MMRVLSKRAISKSWIVIVDAYWIYMWLPGGETIRTEDVISLLAFAFGIACELCGLWIARLFNVWFYWAYAIVTLVLYLHDRSDVHYGFGVMLIGIPYMVIGSVNFYLYRRRRRDREMRFTTTQPFVSYSLFQSGGRSVTSEESDGRDRKAVMR